MKTFLKTFFILLCFAPSALHAFELQASALEQIPFDANKFELFQDDIYGKNAIPVVIETTVPNLKFNVNNNAYIKDSAESGYYLLYIADNATEIQIVNYAHYPLSLSVPSAKGDKKAFKTTIKSIGKNPADYKGGFAIASVKESRSNIAADLAKDIPLIAVRTDLPFDKVDGLIFKESGAFLISYEDGGPYYYAAMQSGTTLKDILLPDVLTKKQDGSTVAAKDNADLSSVKLGAKMYDMLLTWDGPATPVAAPAPEVKKEVKAEPKKEKAAKKTAKK